MDSRTRGLPETWGGLPTYGRQELQPRGAPALFGGKRDEGEKIGCGQAWRKLILAGLDPAQEEARQQLAEARRRQITFEAAFEDFVREKLPGERNGKDVEREMRRDLMRPLGKKALTDILRIDIRNIIKAKRQTAPAQARNLLGYTKRFFSWVVDQEVYGLYSSPCSEIRAKEIIGDRPTSDRNLTDDEMFALWRAAGRQP